MTDLTRMRCEACEGGVDPLPEERVREYLALVPEWTLSDDGKWIARRFGFRDYHEVIGFVNAGAWISHTEDHHPDLEVGFGAVTVRYSTHAIGGLSVNDFICAAKMDALVG